MKRSRLAGLPAAVLIALSLAAPSAAAEGDMHIATADMRRVQEAEIGPGYVSVKGEHAALLGRTVYTSEGEMVGRIRDVRAVPGGEPYAVVFIDSDILDDLFSQESNIAAAPLDRLQEGPPPAPETSN